MRSPGGSTMWRRPVPADRGDRVVVVGGGPVGAALALALGGRGFPVTLIEREVPRALPGRFGRDLRVFALSPGSRALLGGLGIDDDALGHRYRAMHVEAERHTEHLDFAAQELGSIAEYGRLSNALWERLRRCRSVDVRCPASITALGPNVGIDTGERLPAALVVGADGARSRVAELAGATRSSAPPEQFAVVTGVDVSAGEPDLAWQRFLETGPLAFLPLGKTARGCRYSIVWSAPPEMARHLAECPDEVFAARLEAASRGAFGEVLEIDDRLQFPIVQRLEATYVAAPAVALVGDAAHLVHPLAGQGLNMGLRDVAALVEVLALARTARCALDDPGFLHEYQRRRAADNLALGAAIAAMQPLWTVGGPAARLRAAVLAWLQHDPAARARLARVALA